MLEKAPEEAAEFSRKLEAYLAQTLHQNVRLRAWLDTGQLPAFLARKYFYCRTELAQHPCLFMATLDGQGSTPAEISKHVAQVQRVYDGTVAYAVARINSHQRARLIAHGVPFVVPGNQLYLPQLAIDLREHFRARLSRAGDRLSPVGQVLLFHHILGRKPQVTTPSNLTDALRYSAMSFGRAFDELASLELAHVTREGREKRITFCYAPRELIQAARPYMRSPVRKTHYLRYHQMITSLKLSGETALAELTGLTPPFLQMFATNGDQWKSMRTRLARQQVKHEEEADAAIEVWRYDPAILSDTRAVDVLSLYTQFWNHSDERIAAAAAELLDRLA